VSEEEVGAGGEPEVARPLQTRYSSVVASLSQVLRVRDSPPNTARLQIVGKCYVQGLMCGEAALGPLPSHISLVPYLYEDEGCHDMEYVNGETGEVVKADPRLRLFFPDAEESSNVLASLLYTFDISL
jgi:hypothetical protein